MLPVYSKIYFFKGGFLDFCPSTKDIDLCRELIDRMREPTLTIQNRW